MFRYWSQDDTWSGKYTISDLFEILEIINEAQAQQANVISLLQ